MTDIFESLKFTDIDESQFEILNPDRDTTSFRKGIPWSEEERELHLTTNPFFQRENQSLAGKKGGRVTKDNKLGIFHPDYDRTPNAIKAGKLSTGGKVVKEKGVGIFNLTEEQKKKNRDKGRNQLYQCVVTGYISNGCGLSNYQKGKGIDFQNKSLRIKVSNL